MKLPKNDENKGWERNKDENDNLVNEHTHTQQTRLHTSRERERVLQSDDLRTRGMVKFRILKFPST